MRELDRKQNLCIESCTKLCLRWMPCCSIWLGLLLLPKQSWTTCLHALILCKCSSLACK